MSKFFKEYEEEQIKRIMDDCQGKRKRKRNKKYISEEYSKLNAASNVDVESKVSASTVQSSSKARAGLNIDDACSSNLHTESDVSISSNAPVPFIMLKIKDVWKREWERKKIELIDDKNFSNKERADGQWSGKLKNSGKRYFLELAQRAVAEVNSQRDENGMSYARKAMIKCGLSKEPLSGEWKEMQLFEHLQVIIHKHREYFEGK